MKKAEVIWHDTYSHCETPWRSKKELEEATTGHVPIHSLGYIFKEDLDYLTLVQSHHSIGTEDEEYGLAVTIPKQMIVRIKCFE